MGLIQDMDMGADNPTKGFDSLPSALERTLVQGKLLFFPRNTDWKAGDSLNLRAGQYSSFIQKLQQWLTTHFKGPVKDKGNTLPHTIQQDSVSCKLFALNTITHNVFGDPISIPNPASTQALWFKQIAHPYIHKPPQQNTTASTSMVAAPPPLVTPSDSLLRSQTEGDDEKKERLRQLIKNYKDRVDSWAAEVVHLKKEKETQEQSEIERQKEVEQLKEVQSMEIEQLEEIERQKELKCECLEREHLEHDCLKRECLDHECLKLEHLECKHLEQHRLGQARLEHKRLHQESLKPTQHAQTEHVVPDDSMDVDIEPGKVASNPTTMIGLCVVVDLPHLLELEDITNRLPITIALSREVIIHLHLVVAQQLTSAMSAYFITVITNLFFTRIVLDSGHSAHVTMPPPTTVPTAQPLIPGTLVLPMGFLQFLPSSTITTIAGLNRMGSHPVQNRHNLLHFGSNELPFTHLVGPLQTLSGPQPAYLDQTPSLLTRGNREFKQYQDSVRDMLHLPFTHQFCSMGSLLWRLAIQYGPDNLISAALSGPSSDAYMHLNSELIGTNIDDMVKDTHIKMLLDVTIDGHSLWPPIDVFEKQMQWEGEWTAILEMWFMKHLTMIQNRDTRAFATHSQWSSRLRLGYGLLGHELYELCIYYLIYYDRNHCLIHVTLGIVVDKPLIIEVVFWNQLK
ncbi:hypothetical protein EV702DRAFT_1041961 [Suillus placidus]|uniref:Uncharacterized protein n=1 Tax=Suillus placidus TaxID=48579 RepID=A0A9P7D714_9AGAM|nr:hypothetical protein EV702DRAFT_1041961 [Suillus placidus]